MRPYPEARHDATSGRHAAQHYAFAEEYSNTAPGLYARAPTPARGRQARKPALSRRTRKTPRAADEAQNQDPSSADLQHTVTLHHIEDESFIEFRRRVQD